ncbi:peptide-N-glycosidase F-related protein [Flagellimonas pacifica]|uniref:Peptide-N-glycosidase F, C terminal n=1 Tax=Flagellimonas pacifica TaxID=1247520 RepID=A0A285MCM1_9FLAO|nr:peptide-N-glycosidase F-related protein [Allomuricauda parva]SNY94879.1 Peptide-N-glycosidase F, C terminal [Allomuricauda parva]
MKHLACSLCLFLGVVFCSQAQEITHVISHDQETIVTDPSKGTNSYKNTVVFPSRDKSIRQIKLLLTFECPDKDGMRCADWDYVDHIKARPKNGNETYEIARMLTPYGGFFQKDWIFKWEVDVTDFSSILRDEIEIDYIHTGYEDNKTRGWRVTVDFEITFGTPVAEPLAVHKIYDGNYAYGNAEKPIEDELKPVTLTTGSNTAFSKIKIHQTGHGMDADGCGEFCSKYRDIVFNGAIVDHKDLWMACGDNPLYPQAGTWIFDRANWCPGYLLQPDEVLLKTSKNTPFTVDMNMEPFEIEKPSANELISAYVIEYGEINAKDDVTLTEIIKPSTKPIHGRENPTGGLPLIQVKNNGSQPLKKMTITYGLEGDKPKVFKWEGNIPFNSNALITLPEPIYSNKAESTFEVSIKRPNGKKDAFKYDNRLISTYKKPAILPEELILYFKTNKKPGQNSYYIEDVQGNKVFKKDSTELKPDMVHRDTLKLPEGSYRFNVDDTGNNGLEFWFMAKEGSGNIKILDTMGRALKQFKPDFGKNLSLNFVVKSNETYKLNDEPFISMFPSRTKGPLTLDYFSNAEAEVKVLIVDQEDESKIMESHTYHTLKQGLFTYELSYLPKKRYYFKVVIDGKEVYKNRIRLKE